MNSVCLVGRLVADPELKYNQDGKAWVRITIAVDRGISKEAEEAGKQSADFISCIFWESKAESLAKYMKKGNRIGVTGRIVSGKYQGQDGNMIYTTDVRVYGLTFLESKPKNERPEPEYDGHENPNNNQEETNDPFADFGEEITLSDDDLPF